MNRIAKLLLVVEAATLLAAQADSASPVVCQLALEAGLDPSDAYTPAVLNWLSKRYANHELANPEGPIMLGHYKGLDEDDAAFEMSLKMMYWLDLDPTEPGWWLRLGFSGVAGEPVVRKRVWNKGLPGKERTEYYTNRLVTVKMYLFNDVSRVEYAPYRLQGPGNEQSDLVNGNWTGATLKVKVKLGDGLPGDAGFLPFRWFTVEPSSFSADYKATIEILDPFSLSSPSYSYGWYGHGGGTLSYKLVLDESLATGAPVELLRPDLTYDGPPFEDE